MYIQYFFLSLLHAFPRNLFLHLRKANTVGLQVCNVRNINFKMAWNSEAKCSHYLFAVHGLHFSLHIQFYYLYGLLCCVSLNLPFIFFQLLFSLDYIHSSISTCSSMLAYCLSLSLSPPGCLLYHKSSR